MKRASLTKSRLLAGKLKKIRIGLEMSQNQILERLGFADELFRSNISQYERGHRVPSPPVLLAYARLANVDLATLIDDNLELPDKIRAATKDVRTKEPIKARLKR
jgi:transcriptional regulator with XRE-family HTH domain